MHNLHHELLRLHGREHILAKGLLLDCHNEILCHRIAHVSLHQRFTHILQCLGHINLGNASLAFQLLEGSFKFFG